ncbi:MAG: hypothetical protein EAZ20_01880 [Bacteroidetes bacterium]|nr:MAG: hypothetical protein EAZ20_01880 [Bacteroidota bacterium]
MPSCLKIVIGYLIFIPKFKILVQSSVNYQLFKNDVFVGNYIFGVLVNTTECSFKINKNNYSVGDTKPVGALFDTPTTAEKYLQKK